MEGGWKLRRKEQADASARKSTRESPGPKGAMAPQRAAPKDKVGAKPQARRTRRPERGEGDHAGQPRREYHV